MVISLTNDKGSVVTRERPNWWGEGLRTKRRVGRRSESLPVSRLFVNDSWMRYDWWQDPRLLCKHIFCLSIPVYYLFYLFILRIVYNRTLFTRSFGKGCTARSTPSLNITFCGIRTLDRKIASSHTFVLILCYDEFTQSVVPTHDLRFTDWDELP